MSYQISNDGGFGGECVVEVDWSTCVVDARWLILERVMPSHRKYGAGTVLLARVFGDVLL